MSEQIISLTGLRFIAAFFVLFAHLLPRVMPFADPPNWYNPLTNVSAEGMTLFFILSGFVIHYNYSSKLEKEGKQGIFNFFAARFARLYPLYIVVVVYELLFDYSYTN